MNKKIIPLVLLSSFLLTGCEFIYSFFPEEEFVPEEKEDEHPTQPETVEFAITSAAFIDANRHLKVNYTCNYDSPFDVPGHEFSKLNITGVTVSELDITHTGYFTLLSPIENTTLKFEFYDSENKVYNILCLPVTHHRNVIVTGAPDHIKIGWHINLRREDTNTTWIQC